VRVRWRLFFAALVALVVFALVPSDWGLINRVLIGWDFGVAVYLMLAIELAIRTDTNHIRKRCVLYDEGRVAIPVLTVTGFGEHRSDLRPVKHGTRWSPLPKPRICGGDHPPVMELHPGYLRFFMSSMRSIGGKREGSVFQMTPLLTIGTSSTSPL
jgi:hypothetical protein